MIGHDEFVIMWMQGGMPQEVAEMIWEEYDYLYEREYVERLEAEAEAEAAKEAREAEEAEAEEAEAEEQEFFAYMLLLDHL